MTKKVDASKSNQEEANWSFVPEDNGNSAETTLQTPKKSPIKVVHWESNEYVHHNKSTKWFLVLIFGILVFAIGIYLITKDKITTVMILLAGIIFGVYSNHKPEALEYTLDDSGVTIGNKVYAYDSFRSFSIVDEGQHKSLLLVPQKRFVPMIPIYFNKVDEDKIMDALNDRLPQDEKGNDILDKFLRRINY